MSLKTKALSEKLAHVARENAVAVAEDVPVGIALNLMRERDADCLSVCRAGKLVGVFTERDYLMKVAGKASSDEPISKYMTPDPIMGRLDETVGEAVEVMNERHLRHLPLVDEKGAPASVVTVDDVIRWLADQYPAAVVNRPPDPRTEGEESDGA